MRRRKKPETPQGAPAWLLTYGDMVTLCLTFFVLLYSFSNLDAQKWKSVVGSLQGALGSQETGILDGGTEPVGLSSSDQSNITLDEKSLSSYLEYQKETQKLETIRQKLDNYLVSKDLSKQVTMTMEERGLVLRFRDSILFEKGKADLLTASTAVLGQVAEILQEIDNPVRIEGHTDDLPIQTSQFPSNWELSTNRATNVLRFLIKQGLPGNRLSAVGYGEYHPIAANNSEENRQKNRRVDIVIIREELKIQEPK